MEVLSALEGLGAVAEGVVAIVLERWIVRIDILDSDNVEHCIRAYYESKSRTYAKPC